MASGAIECMMWKWWTQPKWGLKMFENFEVPFRDHVGSMVGPRLDCDPMRVISCVLRAPLYVCINIAYIFDFFPVGHLAPPPTWLMILRPPTSEGLLLYVNYFIWKILLKISSVWWGRGIGVEPKCLSLCGLSWAIATYCSFSFQHLSHKCLSWILCVMCWYFSLVTNYRGVGKLLLCIPSQDNI